MPEGVILGARTLKGRTLTISQREASRVVILMSCNACTVRLPESRECHGNKDESLSFSGHCAGIVGSAFPWVVLNK